jgi:predicted TIM-barrel fold metal-dependent hydrolase
MKLTERFNVIDVDTHIIEPADLWTSRMSKKWGNLVPHTRVSERSGVQRWFMGDMRLPAAGAVAHAGWKDFPPGFPPTLDQADPATWQAQARLKKMDEYGIYAAILYPNMLGFQCATFMKAPDRMFGIECVSAYKDFLVDFCSADPYRLIQVMYLPFWDVEESVREIARSAKKGHRGIIFGGDFSSVKLPHLGDKHWDPIMAAAQDHNLSINFHI